MSDTQIDLDALERAALAATPGPWKIKESNGRKDEFYGQWHDVGPFSLIGDEVDADDRFIADANPTAILELISRLRAAEAHIKALGEAITRQHESGEQLAARVMEAEADVAFQKDVVDAARQQQADLLARAEVAEADLAVTMKLYEERQRLLDAIPACEAHGACVPHAIEWVEAAKTAQAELAALKTQKPVAKSNGIVLINLGIEFEGKEWIDLYAQPKPAEELEGVARDAARWRFELERKDYPDYVRRCPEHGLKPLTFEEYKAKADELQDRAIAKSSS